MSKPEFFYNVQQGTPEWFELRRGIPTASNFKTILAAGAGRETYMYDLAGEIDCGGIAETYQNAAMTRGKDMEAEARDYFARKQMVDIQQCGFARCALSSGRYAGASPDGLFSATGKAVDSVLEIKTQKPGLMYKARDNGYNPNKCPSEHIAQVQGNLWVTGMKRAELIVYYRRLSFCNHYTVPRDEAYIANLAKAVERFDIELAALVLKGKGYA